MLVLNLPAFENKKLNKQPMTVSMDTVRTKNEPIRTLGSTLSYNNSDILSPVTTFPAPAASSTQRNLQTNV